MNRRRFLQLMGLAVCTKAIPIPNINLVKPATIDEIWAVNKMAFAHLYGGAAGGGKSEFLSLFNLLINKSGNIAIITNVTVNNDTDRKENNNGKTSHLPTNSGY